MMQRGQATQPGSSVSTLSQREPASISASVKPASYVTHADAAHASSGGNARVRATPLLAPMSEKTGDSGRAARAASMPQIDPVIGGTRVLRLIVNEVGQPLVDRYFGPRPTVRLARDHVEVVVPSSFMSDMLERRFGHLLRACAAHVLSAGETGDLGAMPPAEGTAQAAAIALRFRVDRSLGPTQPPTPPTTPAAADGNGMMAGATPGTMGNAMNGAPGSTSAAPAAAPAWRGPSRQTLQHRLDEFVVGLSNRMAFAAASRLAEDDGPGAPLFIHGPSGVGKTHLLQGLASRFLERRPGSVVRYVSAEAFTNEFITAVRAGKIDAFRKVYRKVDLLCIDDVHFFASKDATQSELLYTLDAIGLEGSRLALASDEHPREIQKLSERLISRFLAGAVVRVETPDPALRDKLVRKLAAKRGLEIEEPALALLVERSARGGGPNAAGAAAKPGTPGGSVREIEGLINQIDATRRVLPELLGENGHIGLNLVRKALGLDGPSPQPGQPRAGLRLRKPISVELVISEVCRHLCVDLHAFMGKGRHKRVVLARSMVASLSRRLTTMSFPEIARIMGRTNHSTVITAQKRIDAQMNEEGGGTLETGLVPGWHGSARELAQHLSDQIQRAASGT